MQLVFGNDCYVCALYCLVQDEYIQERANAMENIHSTIVELGGIFKQLAEMVKEQEETVMRWVWK